MIVSKGICFFFFPTWFQVMLVLDMRLQPLLMYMYHIPCESASHLACNMLAVLNDGWRDQMPVSITTLQLINHSHSIYLKMSTF